MIEYFPSEDIGRMLRKHFSAKNSNGPVVADTPLVSENFRDSDNLLLCPSYLVSVDEEYLVEMGPFEAH